MKKFKIVKEIHTYSNCVKTTYKIKEKIGWFNWVDIGNEYKSRKKAKKYIIKQFNYNLGGIITIDNNIYTFSPLKLS